MSKLLLLLFSAGKLGKLALTGGSMFDIPDLQTNRFRQPNPKERNMNKNLRLIVSIATTVSMAFGPLAFAADASKSISTGFASMAASPLASVQGEPLAASAIFVLGAVIVVVNVGAVVGDTVSLLVQNTADGSKAVIRASASTAREIGISTGSTISAISESTGDALMASGKMLAFVPNAVGKELLHQSKLSK